MAFRQLRELTNINAVKPGGTTTVTLDPGPLWHCAFLEMTDVKLSELLEIRVKANSDVIHRYSATHLDIMNRISGFQAYGGGAGTTGILRIPFDRPKLRQRVLEEDGGINTGQPDPNTGEMITVLKIELVFQSTAAAARTYAPEISASAFASAGKPEGPGTIRRLLTTTRTAQGAGRITWSNFEVPSSKFMSLARVFMFPDANNITESEVFLKQDSVFLASKSLNDFLVDDGYATQTVAGCFPILFDLEGYGGNMLSLVQNRNGQLVPISEGDYRIKVQVDGAMQNTMVMEYMGRLN